MIETKNLIDSLLFDLNEIFAFQAFFKVWNLDLIQASVKASVNSCRTVKMFSFPFFNSLFRMQRETLFHYYFNILLLVYTTGTVHIL